MSNNTRAKPEDKKKHAGGRPRKDSEEVAKLAYRILKTGATIEAMCYILEIDRRTYYNWIKEEGVFSNLANQAKEEVSIFLNSRTNKTSPHRHENKEKVKTDNERSVNYLQNKRANDTSYKLRTNMAANITVRLKNLNIQVKGKFRHLDYDVKQLKEHLEKQFTEGMTWENYGSWHVDHIKPASLFYYESVEDEAFKECWALSNLQPLWATDNLRKGNKWHE